MAAAPVRSTNLPATSTAVELLVNFNNGSTGSTGRLSLAAARQLLISASAPPVALASHLTLDWPDGVEARVYGEASPGSNGVYRKIGASGSGSWTRIGSLPESDVSAKADISALNAEIAARQFALAQEASARQAVADAVNVEVAARQAAILALPLPIPVKHRPGDALVDFGASLAGGEADAIPSLSAQLLRYADNGRVVRFTGEGIAAPRHLYAIEPNRLYLATFVVQRRVNSPDPDNDAIRCALAWYGQGKGRLASPPQTVVQDLLGLTTGSGRQTVRAVISRSAGAGVDIVAPAGARYVRPYVQFFGSTVQNDLEVINWVDITDAVAFAPDVSALADRIAAQESLDAGNRLDVAESQLTAPNQLRLSTVADLTITNVPVSVQTVYLLGHTAPGIGPQTLRRSTGPAAAGKYQSSDGAWWLLEEKQPAAVQFGDVSGDASAVLEAGAAYANALRIDSPVVAASAGQDKLRDVIFSGEGSLSGVYRKFVIPPGADVFVPAANDILPRHIAKLHAKKNPVIVIVGDSLGTFNANTTGRQAGLAFAIELWARGILRPDQVPVFYNRSVGGQTYLGFYSSGTTTPIGPDLDWWVDGKSWNHQVRDLNPDLVILAFGMNDAANVAIFSAATVHSLIDQIRAWPSSPNILLCTNLIPSLGADGDPTHMVRGVQDARDRVAGITRTIARWKDVGLLDFHRQFCAARDGFDPCSSTLINQELASVLVLAQRRSPSESIDFMVEFDLNLDAMAADSSNDTAIVKIGPSALDWLRIGKTATGGTATRIQLSTGTGGLPYNYGDYTVPWLGNGIRTLRVEVRGNLATLYDPTIGGPEGTNATAIWSGRIVREGGWFTPLTLMGDLTDIDGTMTNVSFWTAQQRIHRPTLRDRDLFGGGSSPGEGSLYNHPGNRLAAFVYDPVLRASAARPAESIQGSYIPSLTGVANVAGSTAYAVQWERRGDIVTCWGRVAIQATAAGSATTTLRMSLPVESDLISATTDLAGVANTAFGQHAAIFADVATDNALFQFPAISTGNSIFYFSFAYKVA